MIEPDVPVASDVEMINSGHAVKIKDKFTVNGRTYGVHGDTLYPISGGGLHQLDRGAFQALGVLNTFGDTERAYAILARMRNVGPDQIKAALAVWKAMQ